MGFFLLVRSNQIWGIFTALLVGWGEPRSSGGREQGIAASADPPHS